MSGRERQWIQDQSPRRALPSCAATSGTARCSGECRGESRPLTGAGGLRQMVPARAEPRPAVCGSPTRSSTCDSATDLGGFSGSPAALCGAAAPGPGCHPGAGSRTRPAPAPRGVLTPLREVLEVEGHDQPRTERGWRRPGACRSSGSGGVSPARTRTLRPGRPGRAHFISSLVRSRCTRLGRWARTGSDPLLVDRVCPAVGRTASCIGRPAVRRSRSEG